MIAKNKCFFGLKKDRQVDGDKISHKLMDKVIAEGGENAAIALTQRWKPWRTIRFRY